MKLVAGMRVGVRIDGGGTAAAAVHRVTEDVVELDMLDAFEEDRLFRGDVLTVFAPDDGGLHRWPAIATGPPIAGRMSLALVGPSHVVQRRRHRRFAVDLEADIRRLRRGATTRCEHVRVIDLSQSGARVIGTAMLATGDAVLLDLDIGNGPLAAPGRVAMVYPDGEGSRVAHIAFDAQEEASRGLVAIDQYLSTLEEAQLREATGKSLTPLST